ncbi:MAG: hypothetical protein ACOCZH_03695, partial [Phototrophicaceae bacterium]
MIRLRQGRFLLITALIGALIGGCGGQPERALPTLASIPTATQITAPTVEQPALDPTPTREELPPTADRVPQRVGPTLPPTYTP